MTRIWNPLLVSEKRMHSPISSHRVSKAHKNINLQTGLYIHIQCYLYKQYM